MPSYDYQCVACQHITTQSHGMNDSPSIACASCGGLTKRYIGTAPAIIKSNKTNASSAGKTIQDPAQTSDSKSSHHHSGSGCCIFHQTPSPTVTPNQD